MPYGFSKKDWASVIGEDPNTIHLQGIGRVKAKPASAFSPGDSVRYNYGYTAEVIRIEGTSTLVFTEKTGEKEYTRKRRASTLVAFV